MNVADLPANMRSKIAITEAGCWQWVGALTSRGYGAVGVNGVSKSTHRVAYELLVGPIPPDLQIDHLCRNKPCCNPAHLEPVSAFENTQRRPDVNKSHCINGHEMTVDNTLIKVPTSGGKIRNCRVCAREAGRKSAAKIRQQGLPDGDARHGTGNGYRTYGCRCDLCKAAQSAVHAEYRARKSATKFRSA